MNRRKIPVAVLGLLVLLGGCASVSGLKNNPQRYIGKRVMVFGQVKNVIKIPFTETSVYIFGNERDSCVVFSGREREKGAKFFLTGKVVGLSEKEANRASEEALDSLADFLVKHKFASRGEARDLAGNMMVVISKAVSGLGQLFFVLE